MSTTQHTPYDEEMEKLRGAMHLEPTDRNVDAFRAVRNTATGYLRAKSEMQPTLDAMLEALKDADDWIVATSNGKFPRNLDTLSNIRAALAMASRFAPTNP